MCDDAFTHWSCFYDGVEALPGNGLQVVLTTDGGHSDLELEDMAQKAGVHWFNFVGCEYPDLDVIVVTINGLDYNMFREDSPFATSC